MIPRTLIFDLKDVLFSCNKNLLITYPNQAWQPLPDGIAILKHCHAHIDQHGKRLHSFYLLSNVSKSSFDIIRRQYTDIINLFDGTVTSADSPYQKPDIRIYHFLIQKYDLNPAQCIMIDDQLANVEAAQIVGMHGIVYDDANRVIQQLQYYGIW